MRRRPTALIEGICFAASRRSRSPVGALDACAVAGSSIMPPDELDARLGVELEAVGALPGAERLIGTGVRAREEHRAGRWLERVRVPVEHGDSPWETAEERVPLGRPGEPDGAGPDLG